MIFAVYFPLFLPLLAVPVLRWVSGRLHPALASWLVAVSALVLAGCATVALSLLMFAALSLFGLFDRLGHLSPASLRRLDAVHVPIDLAAGVVLVVLAANTVRVVAGRVRALRTAHRASPRGAHSGGLTVLQDDRPVAHALPGRPGRIVVSTGMLAVLRPVERRALLAHERAHLDRGHHWFVIGVDVLAAANPLLRPLRSAIRYTTERWADEIAAGDVRDRSAVARAVGKAALASKHGPGERGIALAAAAGPVPRRVAALLAEPPKRRARSVLVSTSGLFVAAAVVLLAGSVAFSLDALTDLHRVVELSQY